ncbi:hypothetical protein [Maribacter sp. 2308TA10-17]|uniref:hypothetical protein n=1 Tax=Maribacter sp. 2308TA10-17 TaxID=3386276 RepID=UPI0039BD8753
MKPLHFFLLLLFLLQSCTNHGQLTFIEKLPKKLKENSGIVSYTEGTAWFIEDNGNSDNIYKTDFKGNIIQQFDLKNGKNGDWEDLTKDKKGNLYIGDFGNNANDRKDLVIYKLPNPELEKGDKISAEKITFSYPEQKDFPPRREGLFFDAEAFFHFDEHLYIFTKNRANPFTGETSIYKIQDKKGAYAAEFLGKIKLCTDWNTCKVTSADISPNGKKIVLLGYGKLWVLSNFNGSDTSKIIIDEIDLRIRTQLESVCFINDKTLLLSDEERDDTGGNLYSYTLK